MASTHKSWLAHISLSAVGHAQRRRTPARRACRRTPRAPRRTQRAAGGSLLSFLPGAAALAPAPAAAAAAAAAAGAAAAPLDVPRRAGGGALAAAGRQRRRVLRRQRLSPRAVRCQLLRCARAPQRAGRRGRGALSGEGRRVGRAAGQRLNEHVFAVPRCSALVDPPLPHALHRVVKRAPVVLHKVEFAHVRPLRAARPARQRAPHARETPLPPPPAGPATMPHPLTQPPLRGIARTPASRPWS